MSPILTLQRQLRELGRIRTGNQVVAGDKRRPNKLDTFRLTSSSRELIAAAAEQYGGVVTPWTSPAGPEYEVVTTAAVMDIVVPPGQPVSQWYELWSGGGCQRRCDGVTEVLSMEPCLCPPDTAERLELAAVGKACKATTRLNVILPALPDLGVWRLESHGYYAAVELAGAAELLAMASATGRLIPARLRLEQREKKVPGKPTQKYAVPIIEFVETHFGQLGLTGTPPAPARIESGKPELPAVPPPAGSTFRPFSGDHAVQVTPAEGGGVIVTDPLAAQEAPSAAATPEVAPAATPEPHGASPVAEGPWPPGIDHATLVASLHLADIALDYAIARSQQMFPRDAGVPLTDEQRSLLLLDLTKPAA